MFESIKAFTNGKKTVLAGAGVLLTGIGAFCTDVAQTGFQFGDLLIIGAAVSAAMTIWGFGHKVEKVKKVLENLGLGK